MGTLAEKLAEKAQADAKPEPKTPIDKAAFPAANTGAGTQNIYDHPASPTVPSAVDHPTHYNKGRFEVIDVIEDWDLNFHLGNAVKYIGRAGKKDQSKLIEDLEKARWYLDREITRRKKP